MAAAALPAQASPPALTITVAPQAVVHSVDPEYVSFNLDWHLYNEEYPAWTNSSILNVTLFDPNFLTLTAALAPAHLRIGGSEVGHRPPALLWHGFLRAPVPAVRHRCRVLAVAWQGDDVIYELPGQPCPPNTQFCLTMQRWDEINAFAIKVGVSIAFGLNAMYGRPKDGHVDIEQIAGFLNYTAARRNYTALWGFEFGNELQEATNVTAYSQDIIAVRGLIDELWGDLLPAQRPKLVANDENPNAGYWTSMLPIVGQAIHAATWHLYM